MNLVINERGVVQLARTILDFASVSGVEKFLKMIENHPGAILELLDEENIVSKDYEDKNPPEPWSLNNAEAYFSKLKLTKYQVLILKSILDKRNKASLQDIEKVFKENTDFKNGSMIGGSLAGITKKCESYNIPPLHTTEHIDGELKYRIVPEAIELVKNYLKNQEDEVEDNKVDSSEIKKILKKPVKVVPNHLT